MGSQLRGLNIPSGSFKRVGGYRKGHKIAEYLHQKGVSPAAAWQMSDGDRKRAAEAAGQHPPSDAESWGTVVIILAELSE